MDVAKAGSGGLFLQMGPQMQAEKNVNCAGTRTSARTIGKVAACAAAALALAAPGLAHAVPVAEYTNVVRADDPPPPACDVFCTTSIIVLDSITDRTGGIAISALSDSFGNSYAAATDNNFAIPSVSASARATGFLGASANSILKYYIEFDTTTTLSSVSLGVVIHEQATAAADDGAFGDPSRVAGATATVSIYNNATQSSLIFDQTNSGVADGTQTRVFDHTVVFRTNTLYFAVLNADVGAEFDHSAEAYADPYFDLSTLPSGVTFSISDNIGNALPSTPVPAALPLFASGLGGLAYLAGRRKRKIAAA